jgi:hypothetical protein
MAKIFIHIGSPKTATSTLQAVLSKNHDVLLKQGVLYPEMLRHGDAHHLLACDLIEKHRNKSMPDFWYGPKARGEAWSSLLAEIDTLGDKIKTVVLSSELFFAQTHDPIPLMTDIRRLLCDHDIYIITYLRRQDQLYSSFYNQDVKGARQWTLSAYEFYNTHQMFQKNYIEILDNWSAVFGKEKIIIRPFDSSQLTNGDIVDDFCSVIGVDGLSSGGIFENGGLGDNQLYIKRALNIIGYEKDDNDSIVRLLTEILPESPAKNIIYINYNTYRVYRQAWIEVNRELEKKYLSGDKLFPDQIPPSAALFVSKVDKSIITSFILDVIIRLNEELPASYSSLFARAAFYMVADLGLWANLSDLDKTTLISNV